MCKHLYSNILFTGSVEILTREIYSPFEWIYFRFLAPLVVLHFNFSQILQIYMLYVIASSRWLISLVMCLMCHRRRSTTMEAQEKFVVSWTPLAFIASVSYVRSLNNYKSSLKREQEVTLFFRSMLRVSVCILKHAGTRKIKEQLKQIDFRTFVGVKNFLGVPHAPTCVYDFNIVGSGFL